jgi:hypothetical protein
MSIMDVFEQSTNVRARLQKERLRHPAATATFSRLEIRQKTACATMSSYCRPMVNCTGEEVITVSSLFDQAILP